MHPSKIIFALHAQWIVLRNATETSNFITRTVRSKVIMAEKIHAVAFWIVTPCSLKELWENCCVTQLINIGKIIHIWYYFRQASFTIKWKLRSIIQYHINVKNETLINISYFTYITVRADVMTLINFRFHKMRIRPWTDLLLSYTKWNVCSTKLDTFISSFRLLWTR